MGCADKKVDSTKIQKETQSRDRVGAQSFDRAQLFVDPVGVAYVKPFGGAGAPVTLAHGETKTHIDRDLSRVPTGKLADGAVLAVLIES